jgi:programmed cell death protein 5
MSGKTMSSEDNLEDLRKRKLVELRRQLLEEQRRNQQQEDLESQKQSILRQVMTVEARQRLNRIRLVKPAFAEQIELQLIQIAQSGRIKVPITDVQLKGILSRLQSTSKEFKIRGM